MSEARANLKLLVLGAGGIGGYFGGRLVQAGVHVTFLVRPKRKAQLEADGLQIQSRFGDAQLAVKARLASEVESDYDLVLLTCKAYDLEEAIEAIAPAMTGAAGVLPLLNGVSHLAVLSERFGRGRVLGGTAKIAATLTPEGVVKHLNEWSTVTFGEQDGGISPRVVALKALFDQTSVEAKVSGNIQRELWLKLVHLNTVATMTSLMRANVGEIVRAPEGRELFQQVLDTNIEIARREGHMPDEAFIATYRALFSQADSSYEASLLRDLERVNPIEADHILGFMLERCRAHGLDDSVHRLAYTSAKAYEQRRAAGRLQGALPRL